MFFPFHFYQILMKEEKKNPFFLSLLTPSLCIFDIYTLRQYNIEYAGCSVNDIFP